MVTIGVLREPGFDAEVPLPAYATAGAAGADVRANFRDRGVIALPPGGRALVTTGLRLEIPEGYEVQIRPRSGLALKQGLLLPNSPGTIDWDYRGPLGVIVMNAGQVGIVIGHGERIAQMVIAPVVQAQFESIARVSGSERGSGGFGSTGVN